MSKLEITDELLNEFTRVVGELRQLQGQFDIMTTEINLRSRCGSCAFNLGELIAHLESLVVCQND